MIDNVSAISRSSETAITVGAFDGVHLGHQCLLEATEQVARNRGLVSAVYTFRSLSRPGEGSENFILPFSLKKEFLQQYVRPIYVDDFSEVQSLTSRQFIHDILLDRFNTSVVIAGPDWRFGKGAQGSIAEIENISNGLIDSHIIQPITVKDREISSTWVRESIQTGDIQLSRQLLGRPPILKGTVTSGRGIGTEIGFPTANLSIDENIVKPKNGIYAAIGILNQQTYRAAFYVGNRPTFSGSHRNLELHLIDQPPPDLYGVDIEVFIYDYIRGEIEFSEIEKLQDTISNDVEKITNRLESFSWKEEICQHRPRLC